MDPLVRVVTLRLLRFFVLNLQRKKSKKHRTFGHVNPDAFDGGTGVTDGRAEDA